MAGIVILGRMGKMARIDRTQGLVTTECIVVNLKEIYWGADQG